MYTNILVAVDGSAAADRALTEAIQLARSCGAAVKAVYVVDGPFWPAGASYYSPDELRKAIRREGDDILAAVRRKFDAAGLDGSTIKAETDRTNDDVAHQIEAVAREAASDVIVVGTHGRRGFRKMLLGSVAERLTRIAERPVLLVRAPAGVD